MTTYDMKIQATYDTLYIAGMLLSSFGYPKRDLDPSCESFVIGQLNSLNGDCLHEAIMGIGEHYRKTEEIPTPCKAMVITLEFMGINIIFGKEGAPSVQS